MGARKGFTSLRRIGAVYYPEALCNRCTRPTHSYMYTVQQELNLTFGHKGRYEVSNSPSYTLYLNSLHGLLKLDTSVCAHNMSV